MKKYGLDLQEDRDIVIDGSHAMKAQHEEELSVEAAHDEALNINKYNSTRMPEFIAHNDYNEMVSFRKLPEVPAHMICLAEMELRAR